MLPTTFIVWCIPPCRGSVRHAETGQGVLATVAVEGVARNHSTRLPMGAFFRPMAPGSYLVTVTAPGFAAQSLQLTVRRQGWRERVWYQHNMAGSG